MSPSGRAAVLGSPIEHSLSPTLHLAAYQALGLDWDYGRIELLPEELATFLGELDDLWRGLSLTMPLKEHALRLADDADQISLATRAANTLVPTGAGKWKAYNTDVFGVVAAIREQEPTRDFPRVVVLGAGATARSAVVAAAEIGARKVTVAARRSEAAQDVADVVARLGIDAHVTDLEPRVFDCDLMISTLPADAAASWARVVTDYAGGVLLDVTYAPWPTTLASAWQGPVVAGADLLLWQATEQVRLMTGREAPVEAMRAALHRYPQP